MNELTKIDIEVRSENNVITTTSLEVAKRFNKKHKIVLRDIRKSIESLDKDFNEHNFVPIKYRDSKGRLKPAYKLTKDAFIFVTMGFTGKEANNWKVNFIKAFNYLEQQYIENLKKASRSSLPTSKQGYDTLTTTLRAIELTQKGCTVAEAGRVVNVPESTIRKRIRRVKRSVLPVFIKQLQAN